MSPGAPRGWWIPAFVVGGATAAAGELAAGLLLYSGIGLLSALTLILSVEMGALALGLWAAPGPDADTGVEALRRGWLAVLVCFTLAAAFSGVWRVLEGFSAAPLAQGLGLGLLGGLPLFAGGSLLGTMTSFERGRGREVRLRVAPAAALGAACGFLAVGGLLSVPLEASSILLGAIALLSGTALFHGRLLDRRPIPRLLERVGGPAGEIRVEESLVGAEGRVERALLEDGRPRGSEDGAGRPLRTLDRVALELLPDALPPEGRVLLVGAGTLGLARALCAVRPGLRLRVLEPREEVVRLARRWFPPGVADSGDRPEALVPVPAAVDVVTPPLGPVLLAALADPVDGLVVDGGLLGEGAGWAAALGGILGSGVRPGVVVAGGPPARRSGDPTGPAATLAAGLSGRFARVELGSDPGGDELVVVALATAARGERALPLQSVRTWSSSLPEPDDAPVRDAPPSGLGSAGAGSGDSL